MRIFFLLISSFSLFATSSCAQVPGCTDPLANNFNASATINDGSCTYNPATVSPTSPHPLGDTISETSGLIWWDDHLWTHNDDGDIRLFGLDTSNGFIAQQAMLLGVANQDWEEITQDDNYIYVGDFGNNGNGNRQNLHILRVAKNTLYTFPDVDTIFFSYSDQADFSPTGANNTDFDCEAFLATSDSLYLFSKQWLSNKTRLYRLPKLPGTYTAQLTDSLDVQGLVTGASFLPSKKTLVLCGYEYNGFMLQPFLFLLYDFKNNRFFHGNKRKIHISQPLAQVEGVATIDGLNYFITNEELVNSLVNIPARLQSVDLSPYLLTYHTGSKTIKTPVAAELLIKSNPGKGPIAFTIMAKSAGKVEMEFADSGGRILWSRSATLKNGENQFSFELPQLRSGVYWLYVNGEKLRLSQKLLYEP